ncbi:MAG: hypothetical protein P3B98_06695 [Gemmatimonadota bacterium]|nr:hypothetical protein [Gemmatimonadota bacterium]
MTPQNLARNSSHPQSTAPATDRPVLRAVPPAGKALAAQPSRTALLAVLTVPLLAVNVWGASYYLASPGGRVRHALHSVLRPSGAVGQSAGILAFAIFVFLWLYPLRKKWRALAFTGSVGKWLDVHVTSALLLPLLLAVHAAWRSDGVIGLGLVAMLVVIASGFVGRYLYTRIPRAKSGIELTREDVAAARLDLLQRLADTTGMPVQALEASLATGAEVESRGALAAIRRMLLNDVTRRRRRRELRQRWAELSGDGGHSLAGRALDEAVALADREMALAQQARMLDATHRVFRFWHVAHRPFAVTALVAVVIHIAVVVSLGATWFW